MKGSVRYIITRPCLNEGSLRLLKYLDPVFPTSGPATFIDDRAHEHAVTVDRARARVTGLRDLYSAHNLGVNDVLNITLLQDGRYQVECVVKPARPITTPPATARPATPPRPEPQRVVVNATPHVREVRLQRQDGRDPAMRVTVTERATERPEVRADRAPARAPEPAAANPTRPTTPERPAARVTTVTVSEPAPAKPTPSAPALSVAAAPVAVLPRPAAIAPSPAALIDAVDLSDTDALQELARTCGYRFDQPAPGLARLRADLGAHAYTVLIALSEAATHTPTWQDGADYLAVLVNEGERPQGLPRLTREALSAVVEHARLAPLSPIELRGYWNTGSFDLTGADSIAELVSAHLAQRGTFSFVLMTLAQQSAHSVVSVPRLAERLGSGVNTAELHSILETLSRPPFLALTPMSGGQYYLRARVPDMLTELADYAGGIRARLRTPTPA
ncbi:hypothetical protein [Deinococcus maricopensis]|uniref:Uncharacterized protein n=1 Tax=Deinococcus maricopensis (strain DSM 21211 / LMG 22137 / NRRL B-23946 / LB-34) TaxID=709986 RepID=E8U5H0_DEIML|nr:hypothetical protein [Deinococcus maricopensis]ADV66309.1 hypothetical protein Deima_0652 [Deinococcus maricopensis DSM 21211]